MTIILAITVLEPKIIKKNKLLSLKFLLLDHLLDDDSMLVNLYTYENLHFNVTPFYYTSRRKNTHYVIENLGQLGLMVKNYALVVNFLYSNFVTSMQRNLFI
jgi:hypothetical protein